MGDTTSAVTTTQPQVPRQATAPAQESLPPAPSVRWYRRPVVWCPVLGVIAAAIVLLAWLLTPDTYTLKGNITLTASGSTTSGLTGCQGTGGYSDMHQGATVTIYDASGQTVAMAPLQAGRSATASSPYYLYYTSSCTFAFEVPDVPDNSTNYTVEIGNRGKMTYAAEAAKNGEIALSLGS